MVDPYDIGPVHEDTSAPPVEPGRVRVDTSTSPEQVKLTRADGTELIVGHGSVPGFCAYTYEPSGFESPSSVAVSYDSTTRKVTLTQSGGVVWWWRGERVVMSSPWTSTAHDATAGPWFLSFTGYSGTTPTETWAQTAWTFDKVQVCSLTYDTPTGTSYGLREVHGLMPWEAHRELHEQVGTYRRSGGSLTAGTYATATATDAAVTPGVDEAVVADEDLPSTVAAWAQGSYTLLSLASGSAVAYTAGASFPYTVGTNYIRYQSPTDGAWTEGVTGKFYNVYAVLVPVTADAGSQAYRVQWLQPQAEYSTAGAAQAEDFRSLNLANMTSVSAEFVAYVRVTYGTSAAYGSTGKVVIYGVSYLTGARASQTVISSVLPTSHTTLSDRSVADQHPASAITNTPAGGIAATDVQAALNELDGDKAPASGVSYLTKDDETTTLAGSVQLVAAAAGGIALTYAAGPPATTSAALDAGALSVATVDTANDYGVFFDATASYAPKKALLSAMAPAGTSLPSGVILPYGGSSAPTGYLLCDGSAVSRATYSDLFTAISTAFGVGDGSTTFNVPDLRGKFPQGSDGTDAIGATGGSKTPTITSTDAGHTHTVTDPGHTHSVSVSVTNNQQHAGSGVPTAGAQTAGGSAASNTTGIAATDSGTASITTSTTDGRPPFLAVNYIIKT